MAKLHIKKMNVNGVSSWILTLFVVIACLLVLVYSYYSNWNIALRIMFFIAALFLSGSAITRINGLEGGYGLYLLKTKKGINFIDSLSKRAPWFWKGMAEWGLVIAFGFLSYPIFRKRIGWGAYIIGILSIVVILLFVLPAACLPLGFFNIPQIKALSESCSIGTSQTGFIGYFSQIASSIVSRGLTINLITIYLITIIGGFSLFLIGVLVYSSLSILYVVGITLFGLVTSQPDYNVLHSVLPEVIPLVPGVTIPLLSGIAAFAFILIVHEFSHGILARISKVNIKSVGIAVFGIFPIGAFVEPDEKAITKLSKREQNNISIAGVSANILFTFIFFALMMCTLIYIIPHYFVNNIILSGVINNTPASKVFSSNDIGTIINSWNKIPLTNVSNFAYAVSLDKPGSRVYIGTNIGNYTIVANSSGKIGVFISQVSSPTKGILSGIVNFFYAFFGLTFLLSFFVGIFNLLPIAVIGLDGYRIYKTEIRNKNVIKIITAIVALSILINIIPWIWNI
ncbi:site-2 protease family protein [Candidatus Marsarchaeota archaeon]|nr:site-2 protease family protein [Candidatus Marsarchaeota archaeon]